LEMLSHQNFADMRLAYDPHFKFDFSRSVYKTIVKFIATEHNRSYVIQPLPVHHFSIKLNEQKRTAELSWAPTTDKSEPTSTPRQYVIYIRKGNGAFDNGTVVNGTSHSIALQPDVTYSFKVTALNAGGESFPSEILSAGIASHNIGTILIVNGFTRLESPKVIDTPTEAGFDLDADPGVPYGAYAGYCGRQLSFDRSKAGKETRDGLGYSGSELEGKIVMGNTFDYAYLHGRAIMTTHRHSFTSTSEDALLTGVYNLKHFNIVDVIFGVQKEFNNKTADLLSTYLKDNGHLIISGANITQLMEKMQGIDVTGTKVTTDKSIKDISMRNLSFDIFREMNDTSYAIPQLTSLATGNKAFPMLTYSDGSTAGIAYSAPEPKAKTETPITTKPKKEKKKKKNKETEVTPQIKSNTSPRYIILGFPLESIKEDTKMNTFTRALVKYLEN
ncbi:MAG: fibronectin type III domain-containing protein, partial [Bacteroidaceae bacterium]|nr:fibronectin type III domain-containing protein [Bacteroidaceae bacterium]